jgi:type III secretory pathway component EscR
MPGKQPASITQSQKTTKMLREIESRIQSLNKQRMSPQLRQKMREMQRVHNNVKKAYTDYMNTQIKKDVDTMFSRVLQKTKRRTMRK